jgi:hypothetical protein
MANRAEKPVAADAEVDDAVLRGRAEPGEEGADVPVGRGRSLVLAPMRPLDSGELGPPGLNKDLLGPGTVNREDRVESRMRRSSRAKGTIAID